MLIQITAAQGPAECALAVGHTLEVFKVEAAQAGLDVELLEQESGPKPGTLQSVVLTLKGEHLVTFLDSWQGTVQWTCPSPYRPRHKRKNWFVGLSVFDPTSTEIDMEIRYESCRASGPGGQHVNKTNSAVRATHIATGLSVKVQSERSQHANKRLARQLIAMKLEQSMTATQAELRSKQRDQHLQLERGNPIRVYKGERFTRVK